MSLKQKVIAIDGPSASGKGTVASRVAEAWGLLYLDSGALYRLTALYAQKQNVAWTDEDAVSTLAETLPAQFEGSVVLLNGEDVSEQIRTEAIGMGASAVAQLPKVRTALLQRQRDFLTASANVRAQRRAKQLGIPCEGVAFERILSDIEARDEADRRRPVAPLKQLPDALLLDTDNLSIEEAVKKVLDWYHKV